MDGFPVAQGLYDPEYEKDSCGVGFIVNIKGVASHKIVSDASLSLCAMQHRGSEGADEKDGDGAGIQTAIPHELFQQVVPSLPEAGSYATGNFFMDPDQTTREAQMLKVESVAESYGLKVFHWRQVPCNNSTIGTQAKSKEPSIWQPFVVQVVKEKPFNVALYLLKKHTTHNIQLKPWFYICSLDPHVIVYKGQLNTHQVYEYFEDLTNESYKSHFGLVHSRFSTNTFPSWSRAQPMRYCAHNGEINTLRGNKNWMRAREGVMQSPLFGDQIEKLYPIIEEGGSDSSAFDNVLELLVTVGVLSLPEAVMVMVPEAWQNHALMTPDKRAFYEWAACISEAWDGPALITFADGRYVGASLDRNGLRPCRYYVTTDDRMICASEVGTIHVDPRDVVQKGRLKPGRMLLVDTQQGCVVDDLHLKKATCARQPFGQWVEENVLRMENLFSYLTDRGLRLNPVLTTQSINDDPMMRAFGFTIERLNMILMPMVRNGKEALGSMGIDTPLACLSHQPRVIYDYFKQLFAQVTNPAIDPIRESMIMSLSCYIGPEKNLLEMSPLQCRRLHLPSPVLTIREFNAIKSMRDYNKEWKVGTVDVTFAKSEGLNGYIAALDRICDEVSTLIDHRYKIAILSDRKTSKDRVPVSMLIALGGVHQFLIKNRKRSKIALIVETAEAREVHQICLLLGYGVDAICPYLAIEAIWKLKRDNVLNDEQEGDSLVAHYKKALNDGILKVMSKMGISTLQSYKGAQIFEALGLDTAVIQRCFDGTASRIKGLGFEQLAREAFVFHELGFPTDPAAIVGLPESGEFHYRANSEKHVNDPASMAKLQNAVQTNNDKAYQDYSKQSYEQIKACTLRGLLDFKRGVQPVPLDEVEDWTSIVKRFCTGAMSYGSISMEAHSTLAIAMNKLGGKSNSGEGGEEPSRSIPNSKGESMRSAIKQIASARFGVTSFYLSDADDLQIKLSQGAKPGEGGELPGYKVSEDIARARKSTAGVGLISPPVHHCIYSIEDLKQLIYDLKSSNPKARVSVKLVSEVGVGVIANGVAKAKADHILISGHDGGTGAARWTGIQSAGMPWELGLAETHQTLVLNGMRGRVTLQTDGQIKTGRDVAVACLLGAEEWGFATTPLIAMGCIMMRKCHLNTCPVGIATQDPALRKKFTGQPEHVINFFHYVAEELRTIMASLGFRTINEMVGRADMLVMNDALRFHKTQNIDLRALLTPAQYLNPSAPTHCTSLQDHEVEKRLDTVLIAKCQDAIENGTMVKFEMPIYNIDRAVGTLLSNKISTQYGEAGLKADTIHIKFIGSAGQSFGAFSCPGVTLELEGDANDYVGKGLSGARLIVYPPKDSKFESEDNIIVGNVCLYGATGGEAYFRGVAAERFCVRNSGAIAVVEGVGDHGCEYMTGGICVVLGPTGRNFAAGMSGGYAYVLDIDRSFAAKCNMGLVDLVSVEDEAEISMLRKLITKYYKYTGSPLAQRILGNWYSIILCFVKVFPRDLKQALESQRAVALEAQTITKLTQNEPPMVDIEDASFDSRTLGKVDKLKGFMKYKRRTDKYRDPDKRVVDFNEVNQRLTVKELKVQAARCMDCGVPFCQSEAYGCPIGNIIPRWNDLVYQSQWKQALERLLMTNNFPEFTGRVCPAPCEGACVLGINELPVAIKSIECAIIDRAFESGWMTPQPPQVRKRQKVAIIGSGPAGLAAADQLNKAGYNVTVYERNDRIGGLLMYGIPNMKLDKKIVQRRVDLMSEEGVVFQTNAHIGVDVDANELLSGFDALLVATGAAWPRDLNIPNRSLDGIHFAMEFLQANTKSLLDSKLKDNSYLSAKDKDVIVIGGGDTGCDCIGTSTRHGARSIVNFELLPQPPPSRSSTNPWPEFPRVFKQDYGHSEVKSVHGKDPRQYCILSKSFISDGQGHIKGIKTVKVDWQLDARGKWNMTEIEGSEQDYKADLVLLSLGFLGPQKELLQQLGVTLDARGNIATPKGHYSTSSKKIFAAGDCRRGQSLIVWGINEGRQAAREIDLFLSGSTYLPLSGGIIQIEHGHNASRENLLKLR